MWVELLARDSMSSRPVHRRFPTLYGGCGDGGRQQAIALAPPSWPGTVADHRPGPGRLGEAGVQPRPDLLRGVGAATSLCPGDHHPGGGKTDEACQTYYLPPAHLPTIRPCPTC